MAKLVGLTGGIGTGKSTVAKIFEHLGIPCFYADNEAKKIVNTNPIVKQKIIELFGNEAFVDNVYQSKWVASRVFESQDLLQKLNQIIHPAVREAGLDWVKNHKNKPYCLYEAALITKQNSENYFDNVILVTAPLPIRIARVQKRDNRPTPDIEAIIAKQPNPEEQLQWVNFEIKNDETTGLIDQVLAVDELIRKAE